MRLVLQSFVLIVSFGLIFVWQNNFKDYTIQALGFLLFLYLVTSASKKNFNLIHVASESWWGIFVLNTIIFLLIFSTGSIASPLFFLLYFLGFGIAFIFEPAIVFVFAIGCFAIFLPDALKNDVISNFIKTGSLSLISPLAYFFGREFRKHDEEDVMVKQAADTIAKTVGEVLEDEKEVITPKDVEKLSNVLEETEKLRKETKK